MYLRLRVQRTHCCTFCLQGFPNQSELKRHQLSHAGVQFGRFTYSKGTELSKLFETNLVEKQRDPNDPQFICFLCNKHFHISVDKNNHIGTHFCVKLLKAERFATSLTENSLTPHVLKQPVINVKPKFSCDNCLKTFSF